MQPTVKVMSSRIISKCFTVSQVSFKYIKKPVYFISMRGFSSLMLLDSRKKKKTPKMGLWFEVREFLRASSINRKLLKTTKFRLYLCVYFSHSLRVLRYSAMVFFFVCVLFYLSEFLWTKLQNTYKLKMHRYIKHTGCRWDKSVV